MMRTRSRSSKPASKEPALPSRGWSDSAWRLPSGASGHRGDEPAVDLQGCPGYVGGGGGEQEGGRPSQLGWLAVAGQGYAFAHLAPLLLYRHACLSGPRLVERARAGGVDAPWGHAVDADARP